MLKVLKSGFFTTIQDLGRFGYRDIGVPISGAMDTDSVKKANLLLENDPNAAVLEITMTGPTLQFDAPTAICLSGANISATLNNIPVENYQVVQVSSGDILSYGKLEAGLRGYLAVKGGFLTEKVLQSRSQYFPVTSKKRIKDGDGIPYEKAAYSPMISEVKIENHFLAKELEVFKGPEFDILSDTQLADIFSKPFTVSKENNRMAYQLKEVIPGHEVSMLTSGTLPGTVQFTPAGRLIILMKDGQTTGGYPRVLQLSEQAMDILAQKKMGDKLSFRLV
ncbi:biotin-dependent carboxyltransferase family protein [Flagellimonas alvinocaridis]|uniref:Biotin-dependent carboxyltransferase family protein n=1 Tax=Flagellimonas alvinocaridis TaxID=2530200 RepID=A0A4V4HWS8_9FLAO|nr:biotin-dependent carboxyltransferase family protein [Allomuricauda alvinocaridis]THV58276.1 biotin-dependent carboxyltransferase family protein [Allomuricauda alvinocaridis]